MEELHINNLYGDMAKYRPYLNDSEHQEWMELLHYLVTSWEITALQEETAVHIRIFDSFLGGRLYYKIFRKAYGAASGPDMVADIEEKIIARYNEEAGSTCA